MILSTSTDWAASSIASGCCQIVCVIWVTRMRAQSFLEEERAMLSDQLDKLTSRHVLQRALTTF